MPFIQINLREMKVLVVDGNSTSRKIITELLHEIGVGHTDVAADGAEAIERLRTFPADIMLCDLHMAPLDGIELTRLIRNANDSPNPYLPIMVLTADATQLQMTNAMNAGVNAFMRKPVKMNVLHSKLFATFANPLVYVREGRNLMPLQTVRSIEAAAAGQKLDEAVSAKASKSSPQPINRSIDDDDVLGDYPLTRRDLGFR